MKRRVLAFAMAALMAVWLAGCGESSEPEKTEDELWEEAAYTPKDIITEHGMKYNIPKTWEKEVIGNMTFYYPDENHSENLITMFIQYPNATIQDKELFKELESSQKTHDQKSFNLTKSEYRESGNGFTYAYFESTSSGDSGDTLSTKMAVFDCEGGLMTFSFTRNMSYENDNSIHFDVLLYSISGIKSSKIDDGEGQTNTGKQGNREITMGQRNAVAKAKEYLSFTSFSESGLVGQLEYEGFSNEEAVYGAANSGADWKEQAAKKAQEYLDFSSFSRSGLIDQLIYEGFTQEQAEYGVSAVGY